MRTLPRLICNQASRCFSAKWLFRRETPLFLPFYHQVSDERLPYILNYPYRNLSQFEKEIDFFLKYFKPVSLEELAKEGFSNSKVFHLSFDDGLRECAEVIAPVLLRKGIPATFFINTAFVDNQQLFHKYKASLVYSKLLRKSSPGVVKFLEDNRLNNKNILTASAQQVNIIDKAAEMLDIDFDDFLKNQKPYLASEQIRRMNNDGFTFGGHSHRHPEFWKISASEQIEEVRESMLFVGKMVKQSVRAFAFPFTDWGVPAEVFKTIKNENICDLTFGTAGVKYDVFDFHLQRFPVEKTGNFRQSLKGEFLYYELRKMVGKEKVQHP